MNMKIQNQDSFSKNQSSINSISSIKKNSEPAKIAAKKLTSEHELAMYFKPCSNANSYHANMVGPGGANAGGLAAVAGAIAAAAVAHLGAGAGRTVDMLHPLDLENTELSKLNVNQLLKVRGNRI